MDTIRLTVPSISARVRARKARRKRAADEIRRIMRSFLRQLRHGDYDSLLPVLETYFKAMRRMEKRA